MEKSDGIVYLLVQRKTNKAMFSKGKSILKLWSKVFFITLLLVFIMQLFFIQSYTVSSTQMQNVLNRGDRILVDKTAYGIRLPLTILTVPFTFDSFFGLKSYLDKPSLGYHRFLKKSVERNDIVLFNDPTKIDKPLDKRELILSRCVAIGGDTISVKDGSFFINDTEYISSPDVLYPYKLSIDQLDLLKNVIDKYDVRNNSFRSDSAWIYLSLSKYESFLLNQGLDKELILNPSDSYLDKTLYLVVPSEGMTIKLTADNIPYYKYAILGENKKITNVGDSLVLDEKVLDSYTFQNSYYWFLSDNVEDATDSRSLSIVSERCIIGRPIFTWYKRSK